LGLMVDVVAFRDEYRFLSNFWPARVRGPGRRIYATVEHAYQASKSLDRAAWKAIAALPKPGAAKHYARMMAMRIDWLAVRVGMMDRLLRQKFAPGSELAAMLAAVDGTIREGNPWGDTFWGVDLATGKGENNLGRLLMAIRDELRESAGLS
jgi:ribA/ribD-fused uncharacterized protein